MSLEHAVIAANRFGYGARPGELRAIAGDPRGWVKAQLTPERAPPAPLAALPPAEDDVLAFGRFYVSQRLNGPNGERLRDRLEKQGVPRDQMQPVEAAFREHFRARYETATKARLDAAIATDRPAFERLAHFWANHFTVSAQKPQAAALPASFEREAIRPHVTGRFETMLLAAAKHPGMTIYLDNWQSIGPNSVWAKTPRAMPRFAGFGPGGRPTGLNENLAREILELHALGADGGYAQADVQALAAILTGWTYDRPPPRLYFSEERGKRDGAQLFRFEPDAHEPGAKTFLGKTYPPADVGQGDAALRDIARHPAAARFLAAKLTRHYIADAPPPAAVARVAQTFTRTGGDLAACVGAIVDSPETWAQPFAKFKRPEEYLISALRALGGAPPGPGVGAAACAAMGQRLYAAPGPDGWADVAAPWLTGDLVWKRIEWAEAVAARVSRSDIDPLAVGEAAQGPLLSAETREAVRRAESPRQGMVILLSSPEFQRR
ncbi:MAG: DUF1800 domain-containing protein [Hyphomonadaceae bacterium]|nr:DUF1800 domain-containing protein [Hyphomonadaceae bacterium]